MGDPYRRITEIAAALTDAPVPDTQSRDEALQYLADLCAQVPDFATLEARFDVFGFLVAEVRTVQQLAETPWAHEREVFAEVEPGARVAAAPFRSDGATIGVRGAAPRLGEHTPQRARGAMRPEQGRARATRRRRRDRIGDLTMESPPLRVVVWSTGWIGSIAIRSVQRRPDFELVGVWVHTPEKVGQDAGVLAGMDPIGLTVTDDFDALLALRPGLRRVRGKRPRAGRRRGSRLLRFLDAGVNVVTVTLVRRWSIHPVWIAEWRDQLAEAAERGGASLYASGIEPGFAADQLPLRARHAVQHHHVDPLVRARHVRQVSGGVHDDGRHGLRPADGVRADARLPGAQTSAWGPPIRLVAAGLGVELDEIREVFERGPPTGRSRSRAAPSRRARAARSGPRPSASSNGKDAIVIEHVNRMAKDLAPEWPIGERDGTYRIVIEGDPEHRLRR